MVRRNRKKRSHSQLGRDSQEGEGRPHSFSFFGSSYFCKNQKIEKSKNEKSKTMIEECSFHVCGRHVHAKNLCNAHYKQAQKGVELSQIQLNSEWLEDRLSQPFDNACVEWPFSKEGPGYGSLTQDGRKKMVHHLSLELTGQPRPRAPRNVARHSCDNPPCFNPRHLSWGSTLDNIGDRVRRGRSAAKLTVLDVKTVFALLNLGFTQRETGEMFGITQSAVSRIVTGENWKVV